MVQRTYVPGPNIARGAECDADVLTLRQSLSSGSQQQHSRSRASIASTEKPFALWERKSSKRPVLVQCPVQSIQSPPSPGRPWTAVMGVKLFAHLCCSSSPVQALQSICLRN